MLTEKQLEILKVFRKNLFKKISFTNLKRELKESSSSKLQRALIKFKKEGIILNEKIGKNILISLNLENNKLFSYLLIYDFENRKVPFDVLYNIVDSGFIDRTLFEIYEIESVKAENLLEIFFSEKKKRGKFTYHKLPQANKEPAKESLGNSLLFFKNINSIIRKNEK